MPVLNDADQVYLGTTAADAVCAGAAQVWSAPMPMSGLQVWLDATAASFTFSSGSLISQWADRSGHGKHFAQATPGLQPSLTGVRSGKPTVQFNGGYLRYVGDTGLNVAAVTTFVMVAESAHGIGNAGILSAHSVSGDDWNDANSFAYEAGAVGAIAQLARAGGVATLSGAPMLWAVRRLTMQPDGTVSIHQDGVLAAQSGRGAAFGVANGGYLMGGRYFGGVDAGYRLKGDIGEVLVYDRVLMTAEAAQVEAYLRAKWLIPAPLLIPGCQVWLDAVDYTPGSWPNKGSGAAVNIEGVPAMTVSTNTLNSKPLVRFLGGGGRVRGGWPTNPHDYTMIYVVRWVGVAVGRAFSGQYPPSNMLIGFHTSAKDAMYDNGVWIYGPEGQGWWSPPPGPWRMYEADSSSTVGVRFFIDGVLAGAHNDSANAQGGLFGGWAMSGYGPNANETMDIEVAEMVLYDRKLSDAERQQVEAYLRTKYGL